MIKTFKLRSYLKTAIVSGVLLLLAGCAQQTAQTGGEAPAPAPTEPIGEEQQPPIEVQSISYSQGRILIQATGSQIKTVIEKTMPKIDTLFSEVKENVKNALSGKICTKLENRLPESIDEQQCLEEVGTLISSRIEQIRITAQSIKNEVGLYGQPGQQPVTSLISWLRDHQDELADFFDTIRSLLEAYEKGSKVEELAALVKYILTTDDTVVRNTVEAIRPGDIDLIPDEEAVLLNALIDALKNRDTSFVFSFFDNVKEGGGCNGQVETQGKAITVIPKYGVEKDDTESMDSDPEVVVDGPEIVVPTGSEGNINDGLDTQAANAPAKPTLNTQKKTVITLVASSQLFNLNTLIQLIENGGSIYDKIRTFMCQGDQQCLDSWSALQQQRKDRLVSHVETLQSILSALNDAMESLRSTINVSPSGAVKDALIALYNQVEVSIGEILKAIDERRDPGQAIQNAQQAWANFVSYVEQNAGPAVKAALAAVKTRLEGLQTTIDLVGNVNPQEWISNTCRL